MTDEMDRFDELLLDATRTYNRPPDERDMPLDDMWRSIEARSFPAYHRVSRYTQWMRIAAALFIGVGIGRASFMLGRQKNPSSAGTSAITRAPDAQRVVASTDAPSIDPATSKYLGQAAALLIALPAEANVGRPDLPFIKRANELLLTTRLLLDSPSASDPRMRNLLEDLELVLVQVVRLEKERAPGRRTELELIQQALDQRDVIPRLRNAAAEFDAED